MILIDSNVFMYAAGADHPFKSRSGRYLERIADGKIEAAVDAEALQEILHRYRALRRWAEGRVVYDAARVLFPEVVPIDREILDRARVLLDHHHQLVARDALHAAVVDCRKMDAICSFDKDFDRLKNIHRVEP